MSDLARKHLKHCLFESEGRLRGGHLVFSGGSMVEF